MIKGISDIGLRNTLTQDLLEKTINLLVEEQIRNKNNDKKLQEIYNALSDRGRLDIYNDATKIASKKAAELNEILFEFKNSYIQELIPILPSELKKKININTAEKSLSILDFAPFLTKEQNICTIVVHGDSMIDANIFDGDEAIVLENEQVRNNDIVIVEFEGHKLIKRYVEKEGRKWLVSENDNYIDVEITDDYQISFIGVIKSVIHKVI